MVDDDKVRPRLGRIGRGEATPYRLRALRAAHRAGGVGHASSRGQNRGKGTSFRGRGAGVTLVLRNGPRLGLRGRRGVVKARFTRLAGKGVAAASSHLRYLQRDGVTRTGARGQLYDRDSEHIEGRDFMARCEGDRHQFRFIVAPEDGQKYDDLRNLTRRLMSQMEKDLGTRLEWVAVDHFNTGRPHTHILVRGVDDRGQDLVIARDYLSEGLRRRLEDLLSLDLGPRTDREIEAERAREMAKLDVTRHDRALVQLAIGEGELVLPPEPPDRYADLTARLRQLERWRLAVPIKPGHWRLESDLEAQLLRLGRDETLRRQAQYELTRLGHTEADVELHRAVAPDVKIVGKLLYQGLIDEDEDRRLLLLDGVDGHVHAIDAGQIPLDMAPERGSVLELTGRRAELRSVDRTIARIAAQNGGIYSLEAHLDTDPTASDRFAGTHVRRLEALRRNNRAVVREPDGAFCVPDDYLDRALAYETRRVTRTPFTIGTLSPLSLERLVDYRGETWLERLPETGDAVGAGIGFGRQVQKALQARRAWLLQEGYATLIDDRVTLRAGALDLLRRQDIQSAGEARARVTGLPYVEIGLGDQVSGVYRERLDLPSGRFAIVERAHDFVLAPWREALESHKGKSIRATLSEGGIDWTIGRGRSRD